MHWKTVLSQYLAFCQDVPPSPPPPPPRSSCRSTCWSQLPPAATVISPFFCLHLCWQFPAWDALMLVRPSCPNTVPPPQPRATWSSISWSVMLHAIPVRGGVTVHQGVQVGPTCLCRKGYPFCLYTALLQYLGVHPTLHLPGWS